MSSRAIRATSAAAVAVFALAAVAFTPSVASAQPKGGGGARGCAVFHAGTGDSEVVPDGTLIIALSGSIYQCKDGTWVKVSRVVAGNVRATAVTSSRATVG